MIKIGMFGAEISNINKGVSALAISQIAIINKICNLSNIEYRIVLFANEKDDLIESVCEELAINREIIEYKNISYRNFKNIMKLCRDIEGLDCAIDITGGDSFSDIYGMKLFIRSCIHKLLIIHKSIPFMLAPQTYGPFKSKISKLLAYYIIRNANQAISRDKLSFEMLPKKVRKNMIIGTDVALALPFYKGKSDIEYQDKIKIGINISQLLMTKSFFGKNGISLKLEYEKYILTLLDYLNNQEQYQVHLIGHVVDNVDNKIVYNENDSVANKYIVERYPKFIEAPCFKTPIEAKSYISNMDIFIGSRMHATIAAFSSGVATIPVAYSRKFKGLFSNIGYNYVIDATKMNTSDAVEITRQYLSDYKKLRVAVEESSHNMQDQLENVEKAYTKFLLSLYK